MKRPRLVTRMAIQLLRSPAPSRPPTPRPTVPTCDCGSPLDLSQPDVFDPDRLLGICIHCHSWYQLDSGSVASQPMRLVTGA